MSAAFFVLQAFWEQKKKNKSNWCGLPMGIVFFLIWALMHLCNIIVSLKSNPFQCNFLPTVLQYIIQIMILFLATKGRRACKTHYLVWILVWISVSQNRQPLDNSGKLRNYCASSTQTKTNHNKNTVLHKF